VTLSYQGKYHCILTKQEVVCIYIYRERDLHSLHYVLLISCRSQLPEDFESLGKLKTLPKNINIGDLLPTSSTSSTTPPPSRIALGEVTTGTTTQGIPEYWQYIYHELETLVKCSKHTQSFY